MPPARLACTPLRHISGPPSASRGLSLNWQSCRRTYSSQGKHNGRPIGLSSGVVITTAIGGAVYLYGIPTSGFTAAHAEAPDGNAVKLELSKKRKGSSKEENRDSISSQHLQVKKSWENPGLYAWGSNAGRVVAPDSTETVIKTPQRLKFFDGMLLRDVKLDQDFGAAITADGDLLQWGSAFSKENVQPTKTLRGKDLTSLVLSRDRVIALSSSGTVFSIPVSQSVQESGSKPQEATWFPFWSSRSPISYRMLKPEPLSWSERIVSIAGGLDHVLILTSQGRLFSAASASSEFPSRGQLGVPGLTWATKPQGPYDQPHEITTLRGFDIAKVAAGDYHSLALDAEGRVFTFGDNSSGQLGFDYNSEALNVDAPSLVPIQKLYTGTNLLPRVTNIAAGGTNSFFTVDATRIAGQNETTPTSERNLGRVTADVFSCGQGIWGGLGNGRWTHSQGTPTKVKALSSLFEYDEKTDKIVPIRLSRLSVGATHVSAVMANVTHLGATEHSSENDTDWGADVLWWGGNERYQLGTGRRNNQSNPTYIPPLDTDAEKELGRREEHRFQITPRTTLRLNNKRVSVEQRIECGRYVTAVYSGT